MKLSKLYANQPNFKTIDFNPGVNIIIGRINNPENRQANVHNLGKSILVRLIDYMLLKDTSRGGYFDNKIFENYIFFLEIELNSGGYATIKRQTKSNYVSIKIHKEPKQNFINEDNWDYCNYSVSSKKNNAQDVLQELLGFNVLLDIKYRNSLTYFLRGQNDYNDPFQLSKYIKGKESVWKPILFELLGYDGRLLQQVYILNEKISATSTEIINIKKMFSIKETELDKYKGIKNLLQGKINDLQEKSDSFSFYLRESKISTEIVESIEKEIAELNVVSYRLKNEIASIKDALECNIVYDYNDIFELYNEIKLYFPNELKKSYNELIEFNSKITKERHNKLTELLRDKERYLNDVNIRLVALNEKRVCLLSQLNEIDSFQKFKNAQKEIIDLKARLRDIDDKIEAIDLINQKRLEIERDKTELDKVKSKIKNQIDISTEKSRQIKKYFSDFVKYIINTDAVLSIESLSTGNIEFQYVFLNEKGEPTQENKGYTYMKEICACMDLAIIKGYMDKSYYRFTFHDGFLDGDDPRFAIAYLDLISRLSKDGLQCIVTMIDSVVPKKADGTTYDLKKEDIILELNDDPDGKGKLFGFNY